MDHSMVPHINWLAVPADEQRVASHISHQLHSLARHVANFGYALEVYHESMDLLGPDHEPRIRGMARMEMAAHYCTFCVYHFQSVLGSIRHCLGMTPTLQKLVDSKKIQAAYDKFRAEFPDFKEVRNAAGHIADRRFKPSDMDDHAHDEGPLFTVPSLAIS